MRQARAFIAAFGRWLRAHRGAVAMAGLLSLAAPTRFFFGAVSVMRDPTELDVAALAGWFALFGVELWLLLLVIGYALQRVDALRRYALPATLVGACVAAAVADLASGRATILVEHGVVQSAHAMHAYAFVFAFTMALLFFAHLHRSRAREESAARLAAAQATQREMRRRLAEGGLQAMQARIDPQFLFDMLDAVHRAYRTDSARAERLLNELTEFLHAALPPLQAASSSVLRETDLACAYARLRALADERGLALRLDVPDEIAGARFPPGVLLPLLRDGLGERPGSCAMVASRTAKACSIALALPVSPTERTLSRVRELLVGLYGAAANLSVWDADGASNVLVTVPYESS
jgi:hypothetical protein